MFGAQQWFYNSNALSASTLSNGLIAYYNMSNGTDTTGNGYDLKFIGGATTSSTQAKYDTYSTAFSLSTTTAGPQGMTAVGSGAPSHKTSPGEEMTWAGWYYLDQLPGTNQYPCIFGIQSDTGRIITAYYNNESGTRYFRFDFYTGSLYITRYNPGALTTGVWHHFVYRQKGDNTFEFFHNNVKVIDTTRSEDGNAGWGNLTRIGGDGSSQGWLGYVDEVGLWDTSLSDDEVTELYNSGAGKFYPF